MRFRPARDELDSARLVPCQLQIGPRLGLGGVEGESTLIVQNRASEIAR